MRRVLLGVVVALLAACSAPGVRQSGDRTLRSVDQPFVAEARFSVSSEDERHSGRLSWRHADEVDELRIASPFGQAVAEIVVRPGLATLTTADRQRHEAPDVGALTERVLGYPLPIGRLAGWLLGLPGDEATASRDALGRVVDVEEAGWRIDYEYADETSTALPMRLIVKRPGGPELRLRIEEWHFE